jgi:hypothetical protein
MVALVAFVKLGKLNNMLWFLTTKIFSKVVYVFIIYYEIKFRV